MPGIEHTWISTADVDDDGANDVLYATRVPSTRMSWYRNVNGDGTTWERNDVFTAAAVYFVDADDFDDDGDVDLFMGAEGRISWFENDGTGSFGSEQVPYW